MWGRHRQHSNDEPVRPRVLRVEAENLHVLLADVLQDLVHLFVVVRRCTRDGGGERGERYTTWSMFEAIQPVQRSNQQKS